MKMKRESTQEDKEVVKKRKTDQEIKVPEITETFADPTLDVTFTAPVEEDPKMLIWDFCILIS